MRRICDNRNPNDLGVCFGGVSQLRCKDGMRCKIGRTSSGAYACVMEGTKHADGTTTFRCAAQPFRCAAQGCARTRG